MTISSGNGVLALSHPKAFFFSRKTLRLLGHLRILLASFHAPRSLNTGKAENQRLLGAGGTHGSNLALKTWEGPGV